jgi:hypothetical protein
MNSDEETLLHYVRMAKLHRAWADLRTALVKEASKKGGYLLFSTLT